MLLWLKSYNRVMFLKVPTFRLNLPRGGGTPYMGYIGMCGPKGYGFSTVLVINWVLISPILPPFWS